MKNLILSFLAFTFSVSMLGQERKEEVRLQLAKGMVSFNNSLRSAYLQAKDYNDFRKTVCGEWSGKITKEGEALLAESFRQMKNKMSEQEILKNYSGREMAAAALWINDNKVDPVELFGGKKGSPNSYDETANKEGKKCRWWQLFCHLKEVFGDEGGATLTSTIVSILVLILL